MLDKKNDGSQKMVLVLFSSCSRTTATLPNRS